MNQEQQEIKMAEMRLQMDQMGVPPQNHDGLARWVVQGIMPGSFVRAVLRNDLKDALGRADLLNQTHLHLTVRWLFNYAPSPCWGSSENVDEWHKGGGLAGHNAKKEG